MRLIDIDELKDVAIVRPQNHMECMFIKQCSKQLNLDDIPTAYDIDKVIEQLDKASDHYECEEQGREDVYMVDLTDAIEIVKGGGIKCE